MQNTWTFFHNHRAAHENYLVARGSKMLNLPSIWQHSWLLQHFKKIRILRNIHHQFLQCIISKLLLLFYYVVGHNLHAFTSFYIGTSLIPKDHFWFVWTLAHWRYRPITWPVSSTTNECISLKFWKLYRKIFLIFSITSIIALWQW